MPAEEATWLLGADLSTGLTSEEVLRRRNLYGCNRVTSPPGMPGWLIFLRQFHQPLVYLLAAAAIITASLGEWIDSLVISGVVIVHATWREVGLIARSLCGALMLGASVSWIIQFRNK